MGTAKAFNSILKRALNIHAAWLPVGNTFRLGDYGVISDGVFQRLGNIAEFGVSFDKTSGQTVTLDFASEGVKVVNVGVGASVEATPKPIAAKLKVDFARANTYLLKAELYPSQMVSIAAVAERLGALEKWDVRHKVLSTVYMAGNCFILSSKTENSSIEISGNADVLKELGLGAANGQIKVDSRSNMGLEIIGRKGVIGLQMFKLSMFSGKAKLLSENKKAEFEVIDSRADLEDDL